MTSLAFGTSFAKQLFPLVGAQGTAALRVGAGGRDADGDLSAVAGPSDPKADVGRLLAFGGAMGLLNLTFYMSLKTIPLGLALAIQVHRSWSWPWFTRVGRCISPASVWPRRAC